MRGDAEADVPWLCSFLVASGPSIPSQIHLPSCLSFLHLKVPFLPITTAGLKPFGAAALTVNFQSVEAFRSRKHLFYYFGSPGGPRTRTQRQKEAF